MRGASAARKSSGWYEPNSGGSEPATRRRRSAAICCSACADAGGGGQLVGLVRESLVADVERHDRVAVRRDHLCARIDEVGVCLHHVVRAFGQRQSRPLGLAERCADSQQFTTHPAVQHRHFGHDEFWQPAADVNGRGISGGRHPGAGVRFAITGPWRDGAQINPARVAPRREAARQVPLVWDVTVASVRRWPAVR